MPNGPTETINNLIKRVKRVAFGFRRFAHCRIRALLYAGKPQLGPLATVTLPDTLTAFPRRRGDSPVGVARSARGLICTKHDRYDASVRIA